MGARFAAFCGEGGPKQISPDRWAHSTRSHEWRGPHHPRAVATSRISPLGRLRRRPGLFPGAFNSAIVPVAAGSLRIGPIPAEVGMRSRRDGANGGNRDESANRHASNDRAVRGTLHPRAPIPVGPASPAGRTTPSRCSSPTRLTAPTRIGASARIDMRPLTGVGAGPPGFIGGILDRYGLARPAHRCVLRSISGSRCLTDRLSRQSDPQCRCCQMAFIHLFPLCQG